MVASFPGLGTQDWREVKTRTKRREENRICIMDRQRQRQKAKGGVSKRKRHGVCWNESKKN